MGEIDNQIKKQIYLKVDKTYLKGVNKRTLGFSKRTTITVIQHLFNMFVQAN